MKTQVHGRSRGGRKKSWAVFISGQGSNLSVFLQNQRFFHDLFVVSDKAGAYGLEKAQRFQVPTYVMEAPLDWTRLIHQLEDWGVEGIFLAGFMRILPREFLESWSKPLFNLHPSLLPHYKGLRSIKRAYGEGSDLGVTIHKVTAQVDSGEIVLQEVAVPGHRLGSMTLEEAEFYVHVCEQKLIRLWLDEWSCRV